MHHETTWTPENYEPEDRAALEEALAIQRESEIIELTGWTFGQYDAAPAGRLARMMFYISKKNEIEREKQDLDAKRHRTTGGRH